MNNIPAKNTEEWFEYITLKDGNSLLKQMNSFPPSAQVIIDEIEQDPTHRERVIYWIADMYKALISNKEQDLSSLVGMDSLNIALVSYCLISCGYNSMNYRDLLDSILKIEIDNHVRREIEGSL